MRKVSLFLIVALAAAASFSKPALAQDKAAEVLANMRKAIGSGKLDSLKTFSFEAKTARNVGQRQIAGEIEVYLELPDKYLRVENITAPIAASMQSGFNGDKLITPSGGPMMAGGPVMIMNGVPAGGGGMSVTMRGAAETAAGGGRSGAAPTPEQQQMMTNSLIRSQRVELSRYMLGWFGMAHPLLQGTVYTYAGEAESPDGKAHIIKIKADGGFEANLFIDQATNMPLMLTYQAAQGRVVTSGGGPAGAGVPPPPPPPPGARGGGGGGAQRGAPGGGQPQMTPEEMQKAMEAARVMVEHRVFFTDWKEVDGIQFPHMLQRAVAGTTTEEWVIAKVKVNPKIDAKKFQ